MEEGMKLVVVIMVLFFIALAIITVFSNNFAKLKDNAMQTDEQSSNKISTTWCKISHGGIYYLVDKTSAVFGSCDSSDCYPDITTNNNECNPNADQTAAPPTCCCKCG
ncbi:MAG: hypothetical protein DRN66_00230 [Candidatus Nanohalarchaeota archaeon]|nr:MAG: hypothetical protein DRN66_00230 [Candidatus Nanohaloarchaeota archaeon]